jgi:hypothetical protein
LVVTSTIDTISVSSLLSKHLTVYRLLPPIATRLPPPPGNFGKNHCGGIKKVFHIVKKFAIMFLNTRR